ncbi:RGS domain protein [Gelatoporia subvermispora B]|uniref:RGS domain protein n=1 Tax=Ceriporiopsis subvermispora (strain B) TaxID=914234 RepID=M2R343_CERS8|nr:RGS domain protein [Gelatoporia subvermispora B]
MVLPSGRHVLVLAIVLGVVVPAVARALSSPITILLLSPILALLCVVGFLGLNIILAYALDKTRPAPVNPLPAAARPLAFSTPAAWQAVLTRSQWSHKAPQTLSPLYPEYPVVSSTLNDILIMIVRDFVLVWYKEISSSPSFPTAVSATLHSSLERVLTRLETIDLTALLVKRILPKITTHIEQYRQSEVALRGAGLERKLTQSEELDLLLAGRYASRGEKLHPAVDNLSSTFTKQAEEQHLRELVDKALPRILPEKEARSHAVKVVVKEIVACAVLYPVMDMLSDPDFWNRSIDQVAGAAIRQQRLITKVRNVLEAQIPRPPTRSQTEPTGTTDRITIRTDARHFESFLRSINRCSSLLDARRLKNDIMGEIRRTRTLLASHENEEWINGEKTEDIVAFLDRLYTAKRKVEKRIAVLGGETDPRHSTIPELADDLQLSLRDVLRNPGSLSYLMEFMDRRHRSLLVQFWLTVESFKNPLDSVESGSSDEEDEAVVDPTRSATLKEDISMLNELYFSGPSLDPLLSSISQKYVNSIRSFGLEDEAAGPASERRVRRSVMLAQRQVEREMEQDFEEFQRSELWFRVVGDLETNGRRGAMDNSTFNRPVSQVSHTSTGQAPPGGHASVSRPSFRAESLPVFGNGAKPLRMGPASPTFSLAEPAPSILARTSTSNLEVLMTSAHEAPSSTSTRAPLFDDPEDTQGVKEQSQRMEAIHAALTDIIALSKEPEDMQSKDMSDSTSMQSGKAPSGRSARRGGKVFDDDVEEEEEDRAEDEEEDTAHGSFQLAGPGDLQLSYEIARLTTKIEQLQSQDAMLDTLIKKAELTGDAQELRLLRKSKSSMTRELRELRFQKTQYEQQESANRIVSDRTKVAIVNSTVGEEDGKSVVRYLIEVQQLASDGTYGSGWVVARRYNEFFNMHNKLRERYALVRNLDFPRKQLVTSLSSSFVDSRRMGLEKYLQSLITIPAVCESDELRTFLSRDSPFIAAVPDAPPLKTPTAGPAFPGKGLVRTVYKSVTDSIDDMFFGPSMLDVIIQRLTTQAAEFAGIVGSGIHDEDLVAQALRASGKTTSEETLLQLSGDLKPLDGETSSSSFSSPICDLILAVFELNKKNNWLRRQAIVIILQQVFGGTIERKLRETLKAYLDEPHVLSYMNIFKDGLWPGGQLKPPSPPRTAEEKLHTRDEANRKLSALMPDLAANMIGRSNARRGARRIFAVLQNRRLNQHILYTILDEVFSALFSDS